MDISKYIEKITVETEWTPPVVINDPFKPGPPNPFLERLRPRITVGVKGMDDIRMMPYGQMGKNKWPLVKVTAILSLSVIAVVIYKTFSNR